MINWLKEQLKSIAEYVIRNIVWVGLTSIFSVSAIFGFLNMTIDTLFFVAQTPVQLWETIALALLVSYLSGRISSPLVVKPYLIKYDDFKWKVTEFRNKTFEIDLIPYCKYHDTKFIRTPSGQYMCHRVIGHNCQSKFLDEDKMYALQHLAKIEADYKINKYKTK